MNRNTLKLPVERIQANQLAFVRRAASTAYVSGGNTIACDVMLEIETDNGKRFRIPAFKV